MKFLFLDELKYEANDTTNVYGVVGVLIDAVNYTSFKSSFFRHLKDISWNRDIELKGKHLFSTKGDSTVSIERRILFLTNIMHLSKSSSGKNAKIHVIVSADKYPSKHDESSCYITNLTKILGKLPKCNNIKKSLIGIFFDGNNSVAYNELCLEVSNELASRGYSIFEAPISIKSTNDFPGILFADYVSYIHHLVFKLSNFRRQTKNEVLNLIEKDNPTDAEVRFLNFHLLSYKKENKARELISLLKHITYV